MPEFYTLEEAKQFLRDNWGGDLVECPCCHQGVKLYKRQIHSTMARMLIRLYLLSGNSNDYIHVGKLNNPGEKTGSNDFSKLSYWGLVEEEIKDPWQKEKRTSGHWRITEKGKTFIGGVYTVPKYAKVFNQKVYGFEGDYVNIKQVLGKLFNYDELMKG